MIVSRIDGDTTADEFLSLRQALGIVGFTLSRRGGLFYATSKSVPARAHITDGDLIAVGIGTDAPSAIRRSIEKFAAKAHELGMMAAS